MPPTSTADPPAPPRARILVVDDEHTARETCCAALATVRDYDPRAVGSAQSALELARDWRPDLIILDIGLAQGDPDGVALGEQLLAEGCDADLMFLTSAKDLDTIEQGLKIANQYLTKPWTSRELVARVGAVLRRRALSQQRHAPQQPEEQLPGLPEIDPITRVVKPGNGREAVLTDTEMRVLKALLAGAGKPVSYADIITQVWGAYDGENGILNVNISRLRKKLEVDPQQPELIITVPRVGYLYALRP